MRTMICSRVAGASSDLLNATSLPTCFCSSRRQSCSESSAPPWNGSMISHCGRVADLRAAHEEMSGKVDAVHLQTGAPRHFHVDDRQRDRDAGAAVEHFVQAAVARILVLVPVADELQRLEQIVVQRPDAGRRRGVAGRGAVLLDGAAAPPRPSHRAWPDTAPGSRRGYSMRAMTQRRLGEAGPGSVRRGDQRASEIFLHVMTSSR